MSHTYAHNRQLPLAPIYENLILREEHNAREKTIAEQCLAKVSAPKRKRRASSRKKTDIIVQVATVMKDNPGPGSYAMTINTAAGTMEKSDYVEATTGPKVELEAMIAALHVTKDLPGTVTIHTTAKWIATYLNNGQAKTWQANGWRNSGGDAIKNAEEWAELLDLYEQRRPTVAWVDRHTDPDMKRCLTLAGKAFHIKKPVCQKC